jgi:hypothetical protein
MTFRPYADNVILALETPNPQAGSAVVIIDSKPKHRWATVVASGPGYYSDIYTSDLTPLRQLAEKWENDGALGGELLAELNEALAAARVHAGRVFVANEVQPGDRVIVDALAGQNYALDLSVPRHNKSTQFQELFGERGEFRIVREQEILAVFE